MVALRQFHVKQQGGKQKYCPFIFSAEKKNERHSASISTSLHLFADEVRKRNEFSAANSQSAAETNSAAANGPQIAVTSSEQTSGSSSGPETATVQPSGGQNGVTEEKISLSLEFSFE